MGYPIQQFSTTYVITPSMNADGEPIYGEEFKGYASLVSSSYDSIPAIWCVGPIVPERGSSIKAHLDGNLLFKAYSYGATTITVKINGATVATYTTPTGKWYTTPPPFGTAYAACEGTISVNSGDLVVFEIPLYPFFYEFNWRTSGRNYDNAPEITPGWP